MTTVTAVSIHLAGGGRDPAWSGAVYGGFVAEAVARARERGVGEPVVGVVVVREPDDGSGGAETLGRFVAVLRAAAPVAAVPLLVDEGQELAPDGLGGLDGLLVAGGLTPAYAVALRPLAGEVRARVAGGLPYLGFSAGAAVAARRALVGGYRQGGAVVCPPENGEDLDEVAVVDGLGLLDLTVDVHAAQRGTLGRLVAAVDAGLTPAGVAVDEDTVLVVDGASTAVRGAGRVWWVSRSDVPGGGVGVRWTAARAAPTLSP